MNCSGTLSEHYTDNLLYRESVWLTAHNSFTSISDGWNQAQQSMPTESLFNYGVRSYMVDLHEYVQGNILLCHNSCFLTIQALKESEPESLESFLKKIKMLLSENKNEIITLHFEDYVYTPGKVKSLINNAGLGSSLLLQNPNEPISLGEMRRLGQRLVVFDDNDKQLSEGIFSTKSYRETTYSLGLPETDDCKDRNENSRARFSDQSVSLFVFNHFQSITDTLISSFNEINSFNRIENRIKMCSAIHDLRPNFIAVDFVEQGKHGGAFRIVKNLLSSSQVAQSSQHINQATLVHNDSTFSFWSYFIGLLPNVVSLSYYRKNPMLKTIALVQAAFFIPLLLNTLAGNYLYSLPIMIELLIYSLPAVIVSTVLTFSKSLRKLSNNRAV